MPGKDYFLKAADGTILPCEVLAVSCGKCRVVVAEGHDTGVEIEVPAESVSYADDAMISKAQKELFKK